jgi:hypothetical protein
MTRISIALHSHLRHTPTSPGGLATLAGSPDGRGVAT